MIIIGRFCELMQDESFPRLRECSKPMDTETKEKVLRYLSAFSSIAEAPTIARDVMTGERLGGSLSMYSDGKYAWRSDIAHYVQEYDLDLGEEFIQHVMDSRRI